MSKDAVNAAMQSTCTFDGCEKPHKIRGLCDGHYRQQRKGKELRPLRPKLTLEQRFWAKVKKTPGCWEWTAAMTSGYGYISVNGRMMPAHRLLWETVNGPIPKGKVLDHRCFNRRCVKPAHLRIVTFSENGQHRAGPQKNNTSGVRGVTWHKRKNAWAVKASFNGRVYWGGYYPTLEAAETTAKALRAEWHTHDDHDEWLKKQEETLCS